MKWEVEKKPSENQKGRWGTLMGTAHTGGENTDSQGCYGLALTLGTPREILLTPMVILKKEGWLQIFDVFVWCL